MKNNIILTLFIALCLAAIPTLGYAQTGGTVIRTDPISLGIKPGTEVPVAILFENAKDVYGVEFHLSFNPQVIQVLDADPAKDGIQLVAGDIWKSGFVALNQVDNTKGTIDFAATLLNPAAPISGSQQIAVIKLKGSNNGTSALTFISAILSNRDAQALTVTKQAGSMGVNSAGTAPDLNQPADASSNGLGGMRVIFAGSAILLFLVAAGALIVVLRKKV